MTTGTSLGTAPTQDTAGFVQAIFTTRLRTDVPGTVNGDFTNWTGMFAYTLQNDGPDIPGSSPSNPVLLPAVAAMLAEIGDQWQATPSYFSRGKCRDTSLGGNDAINCYPAFNETDDVAEHPFLSTYPGLAGTGMGRVYSEVYDDQQQIMYITFGVPQFNNLSNFYSNAIVNDLAQIMNNGQNNLSGNLGALVGDAIGAFVSMPTLPIVWINNILNNVIGTNITKYYDFKSTMPLYYRAVNSMVIHLAINLGLSRDVALTGGVNNAIIGNAPNAQTEAAILGASNAQNDGPTVGLPEYFNRFGFDIFQIMQKKYKYITNSQPGNSLAPGSDATLLQNTTTSAGSAVASIGTFARDFITGWNTQLYDASLFIGFKIEKGVDTSETVTNETGESSIAQQVNSKAQAGMDRKFSTAAGNFDGGAISSIVDFLGGAVNGVANALGGTTIENILAGNGMLDFPDVWKSSSFSKSYTFKMSLRSPYGDADSLLQNIYIPLCLILGGALPRAIGPAAYTAPFLCRAYCKGMFAVPMGIISHLTISRGADQFGWTTQRLPTCVDLSFEIKDLSPTMFLSIAQGGTWEALRQTFAANTSFQEYLMTLSGMGLADRISLLRNARRKAAYLMAISRANQASPFQLGSFFGNALPARVISAVLPVTRLPN